MPEALSTRRRFLRAAASTAGAGLLAPIAVDVSPSARVRPEHLAPT